MKLDLSHGKVLIGVVHLLPLPGSPRFRGAVQPILDRAVMDAVAYEKGGASAVIIENFGDTPFTAGSVAPETIAAMARAGAAIRAAIRLPIGYNVLRNDARAALGLAAACEGCFIRVNVHTGAMLTDQGISQGNAYETVRARTHLCPQTQILADVHVKHAVPLGDESLQDAARDVWERGQADALIISGPGTGLPALAADVETVRGVCPGAPILIGSGFNMENARNFLPLINGAIVGSSLKKNGRLNNPVDPARVKALVSAMQGRRP
jgi:membrane complex biogenesis BtpA family protein